MATLKTAAELREALRLVVAAYRDLGPAPVEQTAYLEWRERHGRLSYYAEQLLGVDAAWALEQLRKPAERGSGGGQPPHDPPMLFPTTDDPRRFARPPSRGGVSRSRRDAQRP